VCVCVLRVCVLCVRVLFVLFVCVRVLSLSRVRSLFLREADRAGKRDGDCAGEQHA